MSISLNQRGSSHLVLILAVAVIAAVGVVGYRVVSTNSDSAPATTAVTTTTKNASSTVKSANSDLNSTNVDTSINPDQLDSDLKSVL